MHPTREPAAGLNRGRPIPIRCAARREDAALRHARELLTLDPANARLGELGSDLEKKAR